MPRWRPLSIVSAYNAIFPEMPFLKIPIFDMSFYLNVLSLANASIVVRNPLAHRK